MKNLFVRKRKETSDYHEVRQAFCERFPEVFTPRGCEPKPLAMGVSRELSEFGTPLFGEDRFQKFMAIWTGRPEYLIALSKGGMRYNLDGSPSSEISDEHVQVARQRLSSRIAKYISKETHKANDLPKIMSGYDTRGIEPHVTEEALRISRDIVIKKANRMYHSYMKRRSAS